LDFEETKEPLTEEQAVEEAARCIQCEKPKCVKGCPAAVDCKEFIRLVAERDFDAALGKIMEKNPFPSITSRVCPTQVQCEGNCVLSKTGKEIKISDLERFAAENGKVEEKEIVENGKKAAVVGGGPAGLATALELREKGFAVSVFEAGERAGGLPLWGIPHYKLPAGVVESWVSRVKEKGVEFVFGKKVGKDVMLPELQKEFDVVFICIGENKEKGLGLQGEELQGVLYWNEFLQKFNGSSGSFKGKKAVVIGGGNTAMDCARVAVRLGYEVIVAYRKTRDFMPCYESEREKAEEEGVKFEFLLSPIEFLGNGRLEKVRFQKARIEKEQFIATQETVEMEADAAIIAIGQQQDNSVLNETELQGKWIEASSFSMPLKRTFAAGDITNEEKTVVSSIASAKKAVREMEKLGGEGK